MRTVCDAFVSFLYTDFRIDGGTDGAVLLKTSMGEKETALVGLPTVLLPASRLEQYNEERKRKERYIMCMNAILCECYTPVTVGERRQGALFLGSRAALIVSTIYFLETGSLCLIFLVYGIHVIAVKVQSQELAEKGVRWVLPSLPVALTSPPSSSLSLHRCERGNHGLVSTSFSLLFSLYLSHNTISLSLQSWSVWMTLCVTPL